MSTANNTALPVSSSREVRRYASRLARRHPRTLGIALSLHVLAALSGLAAPALLGGLVQAVETGTTTDHVDTIIAALAGFLVLQTIFTRYARYVSQSLGEEVLADLREDFVENTISLARSDTHPNNAASSLVEHELKHDVRTQTLAIQHIKIVFKPAQRLGCG